MSRQQKSQGFTLIEVVFSGLIFAVAFMGMSAAMAQGTHLNDAAREELAVATATRSLMAKINDTDFDKLVDTYGDKGFDIEGLNAVDDGHVGKIVIKDVEGTPGLKEVTLVVTYKSGTDIKKIEHVQYVTNAIAFGNIEDGTGGEVTNDPITEITEELTGETTPQYDPITGEEIR